MKKKLLLAFVIFFSITSSDIGIAQVKDLLELHKLKGRGNVTLRDIYGNKYTFTKDSVYCGPDIGEFLKASGAWDDTDTDFFEFYYGVKNCTGSAIKTDIAGNRYAEQFEETACTTSVNNLLCVAAVKLGHF